MNTLNNIYQTISSYIDISEEEWQYYSSMFEVREFKKKDMLLEAGSICKNVWFINSGLLRIFLTDEKGKESTFHFSHELDFATDYESFLKRAPAKFYIQAIEDTEALVMSYQMIHDGYEKLRFGEKLGRLLAEKYFILFSNRIESFYTQTPIERYNLMNQQFPGILQRVPQHYIASYLNITPVHLSRLKKE